MHIQIKRIWRTCYVPLLRFHCHCVFSFSLFRSLYILKLILLPCYTVPVHTKTVNFFLFVKAAAFLMTQKNLWLVKCWQIWQVLILYLIGQLFSRTILIPEHFRSLISFRIVVSITTSIKVFWGYLAYWLTKMSKFGTAIYWAIFRKQLNL